MNEVRELVIVGSGPAGLTAALYAARADLRPVVIEGAEAGGQLMLTTDVENYPGFPDGILGPELMVKFREQAERFGAEFVTADVDRVDSRRRAVRRLGRRHASTAADADHHLDRRLGADARPPVRGSACSATACRRARRATDSSSASQEIAVVGGGDSALEEAIFLTKFADKVTIVHRRKELRASKIMQDRAFANPKIDFRWNTVVDDVRRRRDASRCSRLRDIGTDERRASSPSAACSSPSATIRTPKLFAGQVDLDENGYIVTARRLDARRRSTACSRPAMSQDHVYRQAITAAGTGCMAAIEAERWLEARRHAAASVTHPEWRDPAWFHVVDTLDRPAKGPSVADDIVTLSDATFDETVGGAEHAGARRLLGRVVWSRAR